jgi:hypothetical protein
VNVWVVDPNLSVVMSGPHVTTIDGAGQVVIPGGPAQAGYYNVLAESPHFPQGGGLGEFTVTSGPPPPSGTTIALWAHVTGLFVAADNGGGGFLIANRGQIGPWEEFYLHPLGGAYYALQAHSGHFVCAEEGGGGVVLANRNAVGPWETFEMVNLGGNDAAFRTHNGHYLSVYPGEGGLVYGTAAYIDLWERFNIHWL